MKYALISPNELRKAGYRVAQVSNESFEVASPLYWVECDDTIEADVYWYDATNNTFNLISEPPAAV